MLPHINRLILHLDSLERKWRQGWIKRFARNPFFALRNTFSYRYYTTFFMKKPRCKRVRTFYGGLISVHIPPAFDLYHYGAFLSYPELRLTKFILKNLQEKLCFFDIGANIGYYSHLVSSLSPNSSIFAFEPNPEVLPLLAQNKLPNMTIIPKALSSSSGSTSLYLPDLFESGGSTINYANAQETPYASRFHRKIEVKTLSLDLFCEKHKVSPAFIKLDVEGAEIEVLKGAKNTLRKTSPIVAMEVWLDPFTSASQKSLNFLRKMNYKLHYLCDDGTIKPLLYESLIDYATFLRNKYSSDDIQILLDNFVFIKNKP